jgi:hypothetical protein
MKLQQQVRQRLVIADAPSTMASASLQGLDLPKKLCREGRFTLEAFITRVAPQAQLHVAHPGVQGSPKNA